MNMNLNDKVSYFICKNISASVRTAVWDSVQDAVENLMDEHISSKLKDYVFK